MKEALRKKKERQSKTKKDRGIKEREGGGET